MYYLLNSCNKPLPVSSADEVLALFIRKSRSSHKQSAVDYMTYFAALFKDFSGGNVLRTDSPDHFVTDLVTHGWLSVVHSEKEVGELKPCC